MIRQKKQKKNQTGRQATSCGKKYLRKKKPVAINSLFYFILFLNAITCDMFQFATCNSTRKNLAAGLFFPETEHKRTIEENSRGNRVLLRFDKLVLALLDSIPELPTHQPSTIRRSASTQRQRQHVLTACFHFTAE